MGIILNFAEMPPDREDFSLIPIGKYPARLKVNAYQTDQAGALMTDINGKPLYKVTNGGNEYWELQWKLLDGSHKNRTVEDGLYFTPGGGKRIRTMCVRAGLATGKETQFALEPEDLDGTFWWIEVEHSDPFAGLKDGAQPKAAKRPFDKGACGCAVCAKCHGQSVYVNAKVGFAGMRPMEPEDAMRFQVPEGTLCSECAAGKHEHEADEGGCPCDNESHILPF